MPTQEQVEGYEREARELTRAHEAEQDSLKLKAAAEEWSYERLSVPLKIGCAELRDALMILRCEWGLEP